MNHIPRKQNKICLFDTYAVLWTNDQEYNPKTPFIIDVEDVDKAKQYIFTEYGDGYAYDWRKKVLLHRLVTNVPKEVKLMFKDGNKRDCRKSNIILYNYRRKDNVEKVMR